MLPRLAALRMGPKYRYLMRLILASGSPRRFALLRELGLDPVVRIADIDETPLSDEPAAEYVERLAIEKGRAILNSSDDITESDVLLSADTIVVLDGELLGKPETDDRAVDMLERLSGRSHQVMTGVAIHRYQQLHTHVEQTLVHFAPLSRSDIDWYVGTGEPADKAGAYAIQGRGGAFITGIEGSYDNVIGLPRHSIRHLLGMH